jgi:hypothetical protein
MARFPICNVAIKEPTQTTNVTIIVTQLRTESAITVASATLQQSDNYRHKTDNICHYYWVKRHTVASSLVERRTESLQERRSTVYLTHPTASLPNAPKACHACPRGLSSSGVPENNKMLGCRTGTLSAYSRTSAT